MHLDAPTKSAKLRSLAGTAAVLLPIWAMFDDQLIALANSIDAC
jgi:hypothetical protein